MSKKYPSKFSPFWWALQIKKGNLKAKPKSNRCMFYAYPEKSRRKYLCNLFSIKRTV